MERMGLAQMQNKLEIIVDGKFLSQPVTGVQRYAREILSELDKLVIKGQITIAADKNAQNIPNYKNISVKKIGHFTGNLWEQISLPLFVKKRKARLICLCGMTPILHPDTAVVHDVNFKVNKEFFSKSFSAWYNFVFSLCMKRFKKIFTVSQFSKSEILRTYKVNPKKITVAYGGWQHFKKVNSDDRILEQLGLEKNKYFFALSSLAPNKNFRWIAENALKNPNDKYVIGGGINRQVFGSELKINAPKNLFFLGYLTDEQAKSLTENCRAFLFPSFYEGFGIPPLEALSVGAKVVASDIPCIREIYGNSVYYIDPKNPNVDLNKLINGVVEPPDKLLKKYDWAKSAKILYDTIMK